MSSTPSIRISQYQRYPSPPSYPGLLSPDAASPMAIPSVQEPVPPPLPPPSYIPDLSPSHDLGWQWGNDPASSTFGRAVSVRPGSSLLGSNSRRSTSGHEKEADTYAQNAVNARRESSISTVTTARDHDMDDGLAHIDENASSSRRTSAYRLHSERQLEQRTLEESSNSYDKHLLSRIGGPNTPKRQSVSYSGSLPEIAQLSHAESERRSSTQLKPLSVPERRHTANKSLDSPASLRWPSSGAVSPGSSEFWPEHGPSDTRTPTSRHGSIQYSEGITSHRGSYDHSAYIKDDVMGDSHMGNLHIHERSPSGSGELHARAGSKRRACSPPSDAPTEERSSIGSASGQHDIYHRPSMQQLPNRRSPVSRFHPNHSSVSSTSSFGPRQGSLGSSLGISSIPSSATSYGSGRLSPGALSPAVDPSLGAPYNTTKVLAANHQRNLSENTQPVRRSSGDSMIHSRQGSLSHLQGIYICECCPKKPKKFDTEDQLRMHESEKQYTCAYCPNRFKNKNEAERHQNSLHLRRHSWSCDALAVAEAAFHSSLSTNDADVCGFCGEEFPNPPQWDIRAEHLSHKHKFRECNLSKKFFRADHFRQHLKHSHAGTSGKWTNMLENACMQDEPPPEKRVTTVTTATSAGRSTPPSLMVTTTNLTGVPSLDHRVLAETPHDR